MLEWNVRNVDPDGSKRPLHNFATVYMDYEKLYSIGGFIPKPESKYDRFQDMCTPNVPKGQPYVPTMADEFSRAKRVDLWKLKEAYMYVAAAARDVVLGGLLARIDNKKDWNTVSKDNIKQATSVNKNELAIQYFGMIDENKVEFARHIGSFYNQVDQAAYCEKQLQVLALGHDGQIQQD
ncbi:MAG: hypothetical protein EZS28_005059 [Streblomastix strix]|uniref:Uncharacterized protein n=1 Tax=Streblomastix strix TaxID=222440 RepID=A0A5J4WX95_9EUKA|nr:MAG: hypothetical protein EZS28_005059 [Streblomastix strix]